MEKFIYWRQTSGVAGDQDETSGSVMYPVSSIMSIMAGDAADPEGNITDDDNRFTIFLKPARVGLPEQLGDGAAGADETHHFDFPVMGDLTVVINSGGSDLGAATTMDVSMQGSVDNVNWVDLHTDFLDGVAIDNVVAAGVYDYDAKGRMPYMRLELTPASNEQAEAIMIHVVPH